MGASYGKQKKALAGKLDIVGRWTALPHEVIHSQEYRKLGFASRSLLFDIAAQFNGHNNGKLVCCMKYLKPLGYTSNDTITRALKELLNSGLLIQTRQGMKPPYSRAAWFAIGWLALDIDVGLDIDSKRYRKCRLTSINKPSPLIGIAKPKITPIVGKASILATPINGGVQTKNVNPSTPINGDCIDLPSNYPIIDQHYQPVLD